MLLCTPHINSLKHSSPSTVVHKSMSAFACKDDSNSCQGGKAKVATAHAGSSHGDGTRFHGDMFLAKSLRSGHGQKAQHHHGILFGSLNGLNCPSI